MSDIWIVHPNLPPFDDPTQGRDRVDLDDMNLSLPITIDAARDTCERWWGGDWPGEPLTSPAGSDKRIKRNDLNKFQLAETPRSVVDNLATKEFIIFPPGMTIDEAMVLVSVERVKP